MRNFARILSKVCAVTLLSGTGIIIPTLVMAVDVELAAEGKKIAENRSKGNCFTCHYYQGAHLAGNLGPSLVGVNKRISREAIYNQIWDATKTNPDTTMPPFGKHEVLSKKEINAVTEWVLSL